MVATRIHRHAIEVLAKAPVTGGINRQELEAAFLDDATPAVQLHRHAVEVLAKYPDTAQIARQELEAAFLDDATPAVRLHRHAVEVLAKLEAITSITRQEMEAAFLDDATPAAQLHRHAVEVLARIGVPPPTPLAYPTGLDFFLHNWVSSFTIETGYLTDITRSPHTLAEERIGLLQRPGRQIKTSLLHKGQTELSHLLHTLRRITEDLTVYPLFPDTVTVTATSPAGAGLRVIHCGAQYRRFFDGGRLAVFPVGNNVIVAADVQVFIIDRVENDRILVETDLTVEYTANSFHVIPLIDCEMVLEPKVVMLTDDLALVGLEMDEVIGANTLPPSFAGPTPDGWKEQLGLPVFEIDPDWTTGIKTSNIRYGESGTSGRKNLVSPIGPRYVHEQSYNFKISDRAIFWRMLQMFDSKRGSLGAMWEIDRDESWTVTDTDPQFIDVSPRGIFSDFEDDFTDHAGIVMDDGTIYIREINSFQDLGGSWRIALVSGNNLPDPITVADIKRFSRARTVRFTKDAMLENWHTTEVVEISLGTTEMLDEGEVTL